MKKDFDGAQKKSDYTIFLDLDGVVADFDAHAIAKGVRTDDGKNLWHKMDYNWWSTMPATSGGRALYDAAAKLGEVRFLTAPVLSEDCFAGKAAWVKTFLPELGKAALTKLMMASSKDKYYIAAPKRILVDDRIENVKAWEAAGGIGVYHDGDFAKTIKAVQDAVHGRRDIAPPTHTPTRKN